MGGVCLHPVPRRFPPPEGTPPPVCRCPFQSRVQTPDSCPHRPCHTALLARATAVTTQHPPRDERIGPLPGPARDPGRRRGTRPTPRGLRATARLVLSGRQRRLCAHSRRLRHTGQPSRHSKPVSQKAFAACHAGAAHRAALKGHSSPAAPSRGPRARRLPPPAREAPSAPSNRVLAKVKWHRAASAQED